MMSLMTSRRSIVLLLVTILFFLLAAVVHNENSLFVSAAPANETVTKLPGYQYNSTHALPSKMYSGYLRVASGFLHYIFVESTDPNSKQIIEFSNGGPGCSSIEGFAYENGPFQFFLRNVTNPGAAPNDAPFKYNQFGWQTTASMLWISQPVGVAFSYTYEAKGMNTDDNKAADEYFDAHKSFFTDKFPELKDNDFYISGESYAGIYCTLQAKRILDYTDSYTNQGKTPPLFKNFKGIFVGNNVLQNKYDDNFAYSTGLLLANNGLLSQRVMKQMAGLCVPETAHCGNYWTDGAVLPPSMNIYGISQWCYNPKQPKKLKTASQLAADSRPASEKINEYIRFRGNLRARTNAATAHERHPEEEEFFRAQEAKQEREAQAQGTIPLQGEPYLDLDCGDEYWMDKYFDRDDVKDALHVPRNLKMRVCWSLNYSMTISNVVPIWERLAQRGKVAIIYNGLNDAIVPWTSIFKIFEANNWKQMNEYAPWTGTDPTRPIYGEQFYGKAMQFQVPNSDLKTASGVWFVSFSGNCGHMVPQDCPAAALEFVRRIVSGYMFPNTTALPILGGPAKFWGPPLAAGLASGDDNSAASFGAGVGAGIGISICVALLCVVVHVLLKRFGNGSGGREAMNPDALDYKQSYDGSAEA